MSFSLETGLSKEEEETLAGLLVFNLPKPISPIRTPTKMESTKDKMVRIFGETLSESSDDESEKKQIPDQDSEGK